MGLKVIDEFIGIDDTIDCGLPLRDWPTDALKKSLWLPDKGYTLNCGAEGERIQYHKNVSHIYLLEISNPNPEPYAVMISHVIRDPEGYQQGSNIFLHPLPGQFYWKHLDVDIRLEPSKRFTIIMKANSSVLQAAMAGHLCIGYESPDVSCDTWNGFYEVDGYTELMPQYERGLPADFLVDDWGLHNRTDSDWVIKALCNGNQNLVYGSKETPFEFPGYPELPLPTVHHAADWGVIMSNSKKSVNQDPYYRHSDILLGTCNFFSKKQ
jgi:hypothetical protein